MKKNTTLLSISGLAIAFTFLMVSCRPTSADLNQATAADVASYNEYMQWKQAQDLKAEEAAAKPAAKQVVYRTRTVSSKGANTNSTVYENTSSAPAKKAGWSKAAKGAAIGAGVGAVTGAIVNKRNRAAGAAIGAAVGAGGGFVIGRSIDKKDGRY